MHPLFGAMPGGVEMLIVFVLFMLAIPIAIGVALFLLGRWSADSDDEEVELLRDRVNTLEEKVEAREAVTGDDEQTADADDDESTVHADRER